MATATAPVLPAIDEIDVTPEELGELLVKLRADKREKAARAEAVRVAKETGYPKALYNSKYPGESVAMADGLNRLSFYRGKIEIRNAEDEAWIKQACSGRIFEADMPSEKPCIRCDYVTASSDCYEIHMKEHLT